MKSNLAQRIKEISLELTHQKSVVDTPDELVMADKIYSILNEIDYFKTHPENLSFVECKGDLLGRKMVVAQLNGKKKPSDKTVVLIGHFDTVGISDYGSLKDYATQPEILAEKLGKLKLPEEVREDLESGNYMFGRGIFDMKSGDAIIIAIMEEIAKDIENFEGNLVYGAVCDEEGNSGGMLNFVPKLTELKEERGYDYLALIDTDYMAPAYPYDPLKYIYVGTVGKIMPTFYVVGKETHVGESFDGIDPNQIASKITERINLNPEFCDIDDGEVTLPPVTLKQRDLKPEYSVQIATKSILMFNYATHKKTPDQVLDQMIKAGQECFEEVVNTINQRYAKYCEMIGREYKPQPWVARTISYNQLYSYVKEELGDELDLLVEKYIEKLREDNTIDQRDKSLKLVDYVHDLWSDKNPVIVVYFTPPYYPHIKVDEKVAKDKALIDAVKDAIATTSPNYDYDIIEKKFLPCISDMSYAAAPKDAETIEKLQSNMPGYGENKLYYLPIRDMQDLSLPVVDIGPFGKDAHKYTERIETNYTFNVTPELVIKTIMNLLK